MKNKFRRGRSPFRTSFIGSIGFNLQALLAALIVLQFLFLVPERLIAQDLIVKSFSLQEDLKVEEALMKETALKILKQTNPKELITLINGIIPIQRLHAIEELSYIANEDGRFLIENLILSDKSVEVRRACAKALGVIRSPLSEPVLLKALFDDNESVKVTAAFALSLIGEKKESFKFFSTLGSLKGKFPYTCHKAYLYIGTSDVRQPLLNDLNNPDPFISIDAAIIMAQLGFYGDAYPALNNFLNHPDKYIRMAALRGLAYLGDSASLDLITALRNDADPLVSERANMIIEKSGK